MGAMLLFVCLTSLALAQEKVIYGEDHRRDVFEERDPVLRELARSTAAKLPNLLIRLVGREYFLRTVSLVDRGMCADERFAHQTTVAYCSGFLIAPDLLLTAGHCVKNKQDCDGSKWAFDYRVADGTQSKLTLPKTSVYSCKRIVAQKFENAPGADYALIQLDRRVRDRAPLRVNSGDLPALGEAVFTIGHPAGLPTKIADGAQVRAHLSQGFTANLDTFAGNSGSPVFNARTLEVEGILIRGEVDWVPDEARGCQRAHQCSDDGCEGESVYRFPTAPDMW